MQQPNERLTYIERYLASTLKDFHNKGLIVLDTKARDVVQLVLGVPVDPNETPKAS